MKVLTDNSLTVLWNRLKKGILNNRNYEPTEFSGKGYKVLEKNIQTINGVRKNILTSAMINQPNTVYEIRHDFDLNGETIEMQEGCTLKFCGGSLKNGQIIGNDSIIEARCIQIFDVDFVINGYWNIHEAYPEWFGAKGDGVTDDTTAILLSTKINFDSNITIKFCGKQYLIKPNVLDINRSNIVLDGNGTLLKTKETSVDYDFLIYAHLDQINILIKNFIFNTLDDTYQSIESPVGSKIIKIDSNDSSVSNCTFYLYNAWAIISSNIYSRNITINNNKVYFSRNDVSYNYDCSAIYIQALSFNICNNIIDGSYNNNGFILRGGIEAHGQGYIVSNNTVRNTMAGINVVPHHNDVTISNIGYGKLISENNLDKVKYGIRIYTVKELTDLQITNNNITLFGGNVDNNGIVRYNTDGNAILRNVLISGNTINNIERVTSITSLNNFTCGIRFDGDNIQNILIIDNVFSNISHHAVYISNNNGSNIQHISIINNIIDECGNGSWVENHQNYMFLENITDLEIVCNKYNNEDYGYITEISNIIGCKDVKILDNNMAKNQNATFVLDNYILDNWNEVKTNQLGLSWLKAEYPDSFVYGIKCKPIKTGSFNFGDMFVGSTKEVTIEGGTFRSIPSTGISSASNRIINVYSALNFRIGDYIKSTNSNIKAFVCGKNKGVLFIEKDATGMSGSLNVVEPVFTTLN